ncbi:MAG: DUF3482 domain-containing protein [Rhodospirillales bacterium]
MRPAGGAGAELTASPDARTAEWREYPARLNMHAVAEFDTIVLDATSEQRLFEKMRTLLDPFRPTLDALIAERARQRSGPVQASRGAACRPAHRRRCPLDAGSSSSRISTTATTAWSS